MKNFVKKFGLAIGAWLLFTAMLILVILTAVYRSDRSDHRAQPLAPGLVVGADFLPGTDSVIYAEGTQAGAEVGGAVVVQDAEGNELLRKEYEQNIGGFWRIGECFFLSMENKDFLILNGAGETVASGRTSYPVERAIFENDTLILLTSLNVSKNLIMVAKDVDFSQGIEFENISSSVRPLGACAMPDGNVYFGMGNSTVRRLSGNSLAEVQKTDKGISDICSAGEEICVYLEDGSLEFYAKSGSKPEMKKRLSVGNKGGVLAREENTLVAAGMDGAFLLYDLETGASSQFRLVSKPTRAAISDLGTVMVNRPEYPFYYCDSANAARLQFASRTQAIWIVFLILSVPCCVCATLALTERGKKKVKWFFHRLWRSKKSYLFLAPTFLLLLAFSYYPLVWGFVIAFQHYVPGVEATFLEQPFGNFVEVFQNTAFWGGVKNMLIFLVTDILKALIPPLIMAEIIQSVMSKRSSYWAKLVMFIPGIVPGVASLLLWTDGILGAGGVLNQILGALGMEEFQGSVSLLQRQSTSMFGLIFIGFPWVGSYLIFAGALMGVPNSIFEAAELDGCGFFRRVLMMDIPMISPQMKYIFVTSFIASVQDFGRIYLTTEGQYGTNIPAFELYQNIVTYRNYGVASAMGIILFLFIFAMTLVNMRMQTAKAEV